MEAAVTRPIVVLGESDVGKTHYGGQLLKRLMNKNGQLRMDGAATNLEPFQSVMDSLDEGRLADHTATATYDESVWPIIDDEDHKAQLVWPDYGGEQIRNIIDTRRIPRDWRDRITQFSAWLLLIRPQKIRLDSDIFSRPLASLKGHAQRSQEPAQKGGTSGVCETGMSDQVRLIELLQMLLQTQLTCHGAPVRLPRLLILLTCWDEMEQEMKPVDVLRKLLPMFHDFVLSIWKDSLVFGLSALGRRLDKTKTDEDYVIHGSENFGYVVLQNGNHCNDLTLPIRKLLANFG